ncbi:hypothetical protein [Halalkalibacter lacteus]|uniref:hypothetical protein n=1 Tax=Halalkalibacter lacteus TaxID=3090663 RepID=UPI002FCCB521
MANNNKALTKIAQSTVKSYNYEFHATFTLKDVSKRVHLTEHDIGQLFTSVTGETNATAPHVT